MLQSSHSREGIKANLVSKLSNPFQLLAQKLFEKITGKHEMQGRKSIPTSITISNELAFDHGNKSTT
jgi:hypothetical protein